MPRVVAGRFKGLRLAAPEGTATRPTSDKVKEAIFSILLSLPFELEGKRVLDFFAGSGALALEALSRGAASAVLADQAPGALAAARRNLARASRSRAIAAEIIQASWPRGLKRLSAGAPFDLFLLDPPYALYELPLVLLRAAAAEGLAAPGAVAVWEQAPATLALWGEADAPGWALIKARVWGGRAAAFLSLRPRS